MGLDTSHDCWHGAYSAFSRWRNKIAEAAGYEVAKVDYSGRGDRMADLLGPQEMALIDWGHVLVPASRLLELERSLDNPGRST